MLDTKLEGILEELSLGEYRTAAEISEKLNVSEKTIRLRIKELNNILVSNGANIISKQRFGCKLEIVDEIKFNQFFDIIEKKENEQIPTTSAERVPFILEYLLNRADYIRIDDLSELLFVSRNTLTADLKKVEYILSLYNLKLDRRPNYGILVIGEEFSRRVCMANTLVKRTNLVKDDLKKHHEMQVIGEILLELINSYKMRFSEVSFESLVIHIYIAIYRIRRNYHITLETDNVINKVGKGSAEVAKEIADQIKIRLDVVFNEEEVTYVAVHLGGKLSSDSSGKYGPNIVIRGEIDELVLKMLRVVNDQFRIDFRNNLELRMFLNQHMVPLDIRMQYDIPLKNPMLSTIKREYPFAYTVAAGSCTALNEHYGNKVPEDEVGYFAIIFALALEKQDRKIEKKNIVIVCVSGKGSSQLLIYKYKKAFGKYLNNIYECTAHELENFDFQGKNVSYVFTTVPLSVNVPTPVFEVNLFFESKDIITFSELFELGNSEFLYKYYNKDLFLTGVHGKTKEEVIKQLCVHAGKYYDLPKDFYEAVLKREHLGQTDFGNLVAIAHPNKIVMSKESFVVVSVLDKPMWWGHNEVQVVFLLAISMEHDEDIERFYQATTDLLFSPKKIKLLIENPKFEVLMDLLSDSSK
jgi:lichenan operon transcriptional antiterminator